MVRRSVGNRIDIGFLLYQPGVFEHFDQLAASDAEPVIARLTAAFPEAHSFLDVGAGTGRYVRCLNLVGKEAIGIERSSIARRMARERHGVTLRPFDLRLRPKPIPTDLAYSFEVAEHIPRRLARRFVAFLIGCAPIVVLTAAQAEHAGHVGTGHVNEQPADYWISLFASFGWARDTVAETAFFGALPLKALSPHWSWTNKFVFRPG